MGINKSTLSKQQRAIERVGEKRQMKNGQYAKIIEYRGSNHIDIMFDDNTVIIDKTYQNFKLGNISNPNFKTLTDRLEELGIHRNRSKILAQQYGYNIDALTDNEKIEIYVYIHNLENSIREMCKQKDISFSSFKDWCFKRNKLPSIELIELYYKYDRGTIKKRCLELNEKFDAIETWCKRHNLELTLDTLEDIIRDRNGRDLSLAEKCRRSGVSYESIVRYKSIYTELTDEQLIDMYIKTKKDKELLLEKLNKHGINYERFMIYKRKHKELTDDQVIEIIRNTKIGVINYNIIYKNERLQFRTLLDLCNHLGVEYHLITDDKHRKDLDEIIALSYRVQNSYINLLGELVVPE